MPNLPIIRPGRENAPPSKQQRVRLKQQILTGRLAYGDTFERGQMNPRQRFSLDNYARRTAGEGDLVILPSGIPFHSVTLACSTMLSRSMFGWLAGGFRHSNLRIGKRAVTGM